MRIKRRKILKAGAAIAPLAITLHGGTAFATVNSSGRCAKNIKKNLREQGKKIPIYKNGKKTNHSTHFDPKYGRTGRFIGNPPFAETHWDYLRSEEGIDMEQSCMQSFFAGRKH